MGVLHATPAPWLSLALTALTLLLTGCSQSPHLATKQPTALPAIAPSAFKAGTGHDLWVFIEGDGNPWQLGRWPAKQPQIKQPVAKALWQNNPAPSLYLHRPCYVETAPLPASCHPRWWTQDIYSPQVVTQLQGELTKQIQRYKPKRLIFIGHSGGGTLALLLAQQTTPKPALVVTLAGNLNPVALALHHQSPPPTFNHAALASHIPQWHFMAKQDATVPPALSQAYCQTHPQAACHLLNNTNHSQGWLAHWFAIQRDIQLFLNSPPPP